MCEIKYALEAYSFNEMRLDTLKETIKKTSCENLEKIQFFSLKNSILFFGTPLTVTVAFGNTDLFDLICSIIKADPETFDDEEHLFLAIKYYKSAMIIHLLELGANPNYQNKTGGTPFHLYCAIHHDMVYLTCFTFDLFIQKGARADIEDNEGHTALSEAFELENRTVAGIMMRKKIEQHFGVPSIYGTKFSSLGNHSLR